MWKVANEATYSTDTIQIHRIRHFIDLHQWRDDEMELVGRAADVESPIPFADIFDIRCSVMDAEVDDAGDAPLGQCFFKFGGDVVCGMTLCKMDRCKDRFNHALFQSDIARCYA